MWAALIQMVGAANQADSQARISVAESKVNAEMAKLNAKSTSLGLISKYNESQARNAVVSASQGRRGGSVTAISEAAKSGLDWDLEYAKLNGDLNYMNRVAEGDSARRAGDVAMSSAYATGAMSLFNDYQKNSSIGTPPTLAKKDT